MAFFQFGNIRIAGMASAVPTKVIYTDSYKSRFGEENVEKFKKMAGVQQLRHASEYQTASDLGYVAAKKIMQNKNLNGSDVGAIIYAGHAHDYAIPATACVLQKRLGLNKECIAFDVGLGCSDFIYGIQIVASLLNHSDVSRALLVVGSTNSKVINERDHSIRMLFGDASSAVLFEKTEECNVIKSILYSDGSHYKSIMIPAGGHRNMHASSDAFECADNNFRSLYDINMQGVVVFTFAITEVAKAIREFLSRTETSVDDYDCFAFHQANRYINMQLAKRVKIPLEKMPMSITNFGNTAGAAIPLLLNDRYGNAESGNIKVLMCGFGAGLSWGVCSLELDLGEIYTVEETDEVYTEGIIDDPRKLEI